jgi:hypothetical protein
MQPPNREMPDASIDLGEYLQRVAIRTPVAPDLRTLRAIVRVAPLGGLFARQWGTPVALWFGWLSTAC